MHDKIFSPSLMKIKILIILLPLKERNEFGHMSTETHTCKLTYPPFSTTSKFMKNTTNVITYIFSTFK